jgi:hypothetical protein
VAEQFPPNLTLPVLIQIVEKMIEALGDKEIRMDGISKRSRAAVFLFIDRHWTSFQEELRYWFCADEQQRRIDPEPE